MRRTVYEGPFRTAWSEGLSMFSVISGAILIGAGGGSFWYLLPRNGVVHPLVRNSDVGSMITIGIMSLVVFGVVLVSIAAFE
jgi:hypothetical protein